MYGNVHPSGAIVRGYWNRMWARSIGKVMLVYIMHQNVIRSRIQFDF